MKIQRVELCSKYHADIYCPYCGTLVFNQSEELQDLEEMLNPCPHTLFFAYDYDLHYRSSRFDQIKSIQGLSSDEISDGESFTGWDDFTDEVEVWDGVKFAMYVGPPSGEGSYLGFATVDD